MFREVALGLTVLLAAPQAAAAPALEEALAPLLEPGDLVFKGADSGPATQLAASWSDGDRRWGHVGIVLSPAKPGECPAEEQSTGAVQKQCNSDTIVVHADTGPGPGEEALPPGAVIGAVRAVSLDQFLGEADHAGLFRLQIGPEARAAMLDWAAEAARVHTPFDRGYSLASENSLYCTELVWRALSAGLGEDAVPQKSRRLGRVYVALSDLSQHPLAAEIADIDLTPAEDEDTDGAS